MSKEKQSKSAPPASKSVEDFRAAHDKNYIVPKKIEAAIKALTPTGWDYELNFLKLAQLSTTDLAMFREQFAEFLVDVGGRNTKRVWCGSKALAIKLKEMV